MSVPAQPLSTVPGTMNWDPVRQKLLDNSLDDALEAARELRKNIDITRSSEFPLMLSALLPAFSSLLFHKTKANPDTSTVEHQVRNEILELINDFPKNEVIRPHAPHLVALAMDVLNKDYEENALVASKILLDSYKIYRPLPHDYVQPYLDFVINSYRALPSTVQRNFAQIVGASAAVPATVSSETSMDVDTEESTSAAPKDDPANKPKPSLRSGASFKVLKECPLTVMLMFQLYPKFLKNNIAELIKVMMEALGLRAPRLDSILPKDTKPDVVIKRAYASQTRELVAAQAKTLSFLTYLLRSFSSELKPHEERLATNVVALMSSCPRDSTGTRKELLVATRHLLNTEFRKGFYRHIDSLLDERVLLGAQHRFSDQSALRPLGYLTLSELVQHVRTFLPMKTMTRVVTMFCRILHDSSNLPASTQFSAVRTLLSLVDSIAKNKDPDPQLGRDMLVRMLLSFVDKLEAIQRYFPIVLERERDQAAKGTNVTLARSETDWDGGNIDSVRDLQGMIRIIIVGNKTLIQSIHSYRSHLEKERIREMMIPPPGSNEEVASAAHKMSCTEAALINRYVDVALETVKLLKESVSENQDFGRMAGEKSLSEYHRDGLTYFAATFVSFDGYTLRRTLGVNFQTVVDAIVLDPVVMQVPRHLLAQNAATSFEFSNILLTFLVENLSELDYSQCESCIFLDEKAEVVASPDEASDIHESVASVSMRPILSDDKRKEKATVYLQLFERFLKSLTVYSENEVVLRRHLRAIVATCMKKLTENFDAWPDNYCMLLRYTFRAISQGKFQDSYKELLPLLSTVLNGLYRIICCTDDLTIRSTAIEMCLTIPARLSSLLPHLALLLRVIVAALRSDAGDLANLGLRTLEFWIDNLNPNFLFPELSQQKHLFKDLIQALSLHLQPAPYPYGLLTLRLLGKLGGKSRAFLRDPLSMQLFDPVDERGPEIQCSWLRCGNTRTKEKNQESVTITVSLGRCTEIIRVLSMIACAEKSEIAGEANDQTTNQEDHEDDSWLWEGKLSSERIQRFASTVTKRTLESQARSCFDILRTSVAQSKASESSESQDTILTGLLYASSLSGEIGRDARGLLRESISHFEISKLSDCICGLLSERSCIGVESLLETITFIIEEKGGDSLVAPLVEGICERLMTHCKDFPAGLVQALCCIVAEKGNEWAQQHALLVILSCFHSLKAIPQEMAAESMKMLQSIFRLSALLFGGQPHEMNDTILFDELILTGESTRRRPESKKRVPLADEVFLFLVSELAAQHCLARFAARMLLNLYVPETDEVENDPFRANFTHLKHTLFSRSLKVLPLPQQTAVVEATAYVMRRRPKLFPLSDQHILAFLSEFLKFASVADGALTDDSLLGSVVDRDGYVGTTKESDQSFGHASGIFLRRLCVLQTVFGRVVVPQDAPEGIKLRAAGIKLAHFTILGHSDEFFNAETQSTLGNIRPHVVSLFFRSLVSTAPKIVNAAFIALFDVQRLSMTRTTDDQGEASTRSRLPKELLQTCIRPVLLELRQFSSLSLSLLRGLSRLLSLLSSWFNRTLGEKLLEHLQKWTNTTRIRELRLLDDSRETIVAAACVELFSSIPHGANFVEPLVKTCIKLEASLPAYKARVIHSPYRIPLAKFLNKYPSQAVEFFLPRLKTPLYSELFQGLLKISECSELRKRLSESECSNRILNTCFERPLAIIRAEKSGSDSRASLAVYGVGSGTTPVDPGESQIMTTECLELQYQGFRIIDTLSSFDTSFFMTHNDFIRAFRLLWRSRGRHMRILHEDMIPPRYAEESKFMAQFLVTYSSLYPNEEGVFFELVLVFLQNSICDFSFITHFINQIVQRMSLENRRQIISRFFSHIGGDRNDEPKVLRLHHLAYPVLASSLGRQKKEDQDVIDKDTVETFINEVFLPNSEQFSDRFRAEVLRMLLLLAEKTTFLLDKSSEIIDVCILIAKGADESAKGRALMLACQLVRSTKQKSEYGLSLFHELLVTHQPEGKEFIRSSLDRLLPSLLETSGSGSGLPAKELENVIDQAYKLIEDEGKSIPQIAHVCIIITRYPFVFGRAKLKFMKPLIACLNRLGLPVNSTIENKVISVDVAELLASWTVKQDVFPEDFEKQKVVDPLVNFLVRLKMLLAEPSDSRTGRIDPSTFALDSRVTEILHRSLSTWHVSINSEPFEKAHSRDKIPPTLLFSCVQIFSFILEANMDAFLRRHSAIVSKVLSLSFALVKDEPRMKEELKRLAASVKSVSHYELLLIPLEQLLVAANLQLRKFSLQSSSLNRQSSRDKGKVVEDDHASLESIEFAMAFIKESGLNKTNTKGYLESTLLTLANTLCKGHLSDAAKHRQGSLDPSRGSYGGVKHPSPTKGILEEVLSDVLSSNTRSYASRGRKKPDKEPMEVTCLVDILELFEGDDELLFRFSRSRRGLLNMLVSVLENSDSPLLLVMAARMIGKQILKPNESRPLTAKETQSFIWKLVSFDSCILSNDLDILPLSSVVGHFVKLLWEYSKDEKDSENNFARNVVVFMMDPREEKRSAFRSLFYGFRDTNSLTKGSFTCISELWRAIHTDLDSLGSRFWTVFVVDILLDSLTSDDEDSFGAVRTLVHSDPLLCQQVLKSLLLSAWSLPLEDEVRFGLAKGFESLLIKHSNSQFLLRGSIKPGRDFPRNPASSLLKIISSLEPLPITDPHSLVHVAEHYNCWYESLDLLEEWCFGPEVPASRDTVLALSACSTKLLGPKMKIHLVDEDLLSERGRRAMSLDVHGLIEEAVGAYSDLMSDWETSTEKDKVLPSELDLWEERWIEVNQELCQFEVLDEFSKVARSELLELECSAKEQNWSRLKELLSSPSIESSLEKGEPISKINETKLAIIERRLDEYHNPHAQCAQLCLYNWQLLPGLCHASSAHSRLLHQFHRLVEIRESGQIMEEIQSHSNGKTFPDLKNLLQTWRDRLPSQFEELSNWEDIISWRNAVFTSITTTFSWADPQRLASLHDRTWNTIRIAKAARKQNLVETPLYLLDRASDDRTLSVEDAFIKLREQMYGYFRPEDKEALREGLNFINNTKLSYFDDPQKSEILRLKGRFYNLMDDNKKAHQAYSHAVQVCPTHAKAWSDWGKICSHFASEKDSSGADASDQKKVAQYLAQALGSYLHSVLLDSSSLNRLSLVKCLSILSKEDIAPGVLSQTFDGRVSQLPAWIWIPWSPQLLTSLYRHEGRAVKNLLSRIVKGYPQAIYHGLRAYYLERRDVERVRSGGSGSGSSQSQHMPSVTYAEELMSTFRRSHASLWTALESILEEIVVKYRTSHEEEFLATLVALQERVESQLLSDENDDSIVSSVWKTIDRITKKYFKQSDVNRSDERSVRAVDFKDKYRDAFEKDFQVSSNEDDKSADGPKVPAIPVDKLVANIRKWRDNLEEIVAQLPESVSLASSSRRLATFSQGSAPDLWPGSCDPKNACSRYRKQQGVNFDTDSSISTVSTSSSASAADKAANAAIAMCIAAAAREGTSGDYGGGASIVEVPGQYSPQSCSWSDSRPCPELHYKLAKFHPRVKIEKRNEQIIRCISMLSHDGTTHHFMVQAALPYLTRADERTAQVNYVLDKIFSHDSSARQQFLAVQTYPTIPVAQRLRLVQEPEHTKSLQDIAEQVLGVDLDSLARKFNHDAIDCHRKRTSKSREDKELEWRLELFRRSFAEQLSSENTKAVLKTYCSTVLANAEDVHNFRRTFAKQYAVNSVLQHSMSIAERTPGRLAFSLQDGRVLSREFRLNYSANGIIEDLPVPFRLSPAIIHAIGETYMRSHFFVSFGTTARAICAADDDFAPVLRVLLRDDLVGFFTKSMAKSDAKTVELERQLADRLSENISKIQKKLKDCDPSKSPITEENRPIDEHLRKLADDARADANVALMNGAFHGWL